VKIVSEVGLVNSEDRWVTLINNTSLYSVTVNKLLFPRGVGGLAAVLEGLLAMSRLTAYLYSIVYEIGI
jgi:hypothetical protein